MEIAEGQVLQLPFDMTNPQAVRQGGIDVEHLPGDPVALFRGGVFHIPNGTGPLGELDQGYPHVIDHGDQHAADVVHLAFSLAQDIAANGMAQRRDRRHLQDTVYQLGDRRAEVPLDLFQGQLPFPYGPVEDGRHQGLFIQMQLRQDLGHFQSGTKAAGALGPDRAFLNGDLLDLLAQLAGATQRLHILQSRPLSQPLKPALDVDFAIRGNRMVFANLDHTQPVRSLTFQTGRWTPREWYAETCP